MNAARQPTALIVADSHFHLDPDPAEQRRLQRFLELLEVAQRADHLVLLGDIFDFWFDYPHFRLKGYDGLLAALDGVKAAGTRIHFVGGNHDIWAAGYLHRRYGCLPEGESLLLDLGGLRVLCEHGDGLLSHDWLYRSFRAIVRTRAGIVLAKSLHPELLYRISTWLSRRSRNATRDEAAGIEAKAAAWLQKQGDAPWDLLVIGHMHHRCEAAAHGRRLAVLGGWLDSLDYAVLQGGGLSLRDFDRDPRPEF